MLIGAVAVFAATTVAVVITDHPANSSETPSSSLTIVHVRRGTLIVKVTAGGTLAGASAPLAFGTSGAGVVTQVPAVGSIIREGQALYRLNNEPVVLLYGSTPVYRSFAPGMSPGPDVVELEQDLNQLGFGRTYGLTANGDFNFADEQTVRAFNRAEGLPAGDKIGQGSVLFEPGPVVVASDSVGLGASVAAGGAVVSLEMDTPKLRCNCRRRRPRASPLGRRHWSLSLHHP